MAVWSQRVGIALFSFLLGIFAGRELMKAEFRNAMAAAFSTVSGEPAARSERPAEPRVPFRFEVKMPRPALGESGCIVPYEIKSAGPSLSKVTVFGVSAANEIVDSARRYGPFRAGSIVEFTFMRAKCQDISQFRTEEE